jgi:hypothetical protein
MIVVGGAVAAVAVVALLVVGLWFSGGGTPLSVSTDPPGAAVYLDGEALGRTPLEAVPVEGGGGRLRIERVGYALVDTTVTFDKGQPFALDIPLVALAPGEAPVSVLEVASSPSGATVSINGERVGETPYTHRDSTGRPLAVRVERVGYRPWIRRGVLLEPEETTSLQADLQRAQAGPVEPSADPGGADDPPPAQPGRLTLNTAPSGGTVSVAGQRRPSGSTFEVPSGSQTVRCEHPQFGSFQPTVQVRAGQSASATCYFQATINVNATMEEGGFVWGAVLVNGEPTGDNTPAVLTLGPGTYTIMVRRNGYQTLGPSRTITIEPSLEPQRESMGFRLRRQ